MKVILNVSQSYFSIAKYSGGIKYNGVDYIYIPIHDALIMQKYVKKYGSHIKKGGTWEEFIETIKNLEREK